MYVRSTLYEKLSSEKRHDRVLETSFKRVRNLPFKLFSNRKLSSSANHGDDIFEDFEPPSKNSQLPPCLLRIFCLLSWEIDFLKWDSKSKQNKCRKFLRISNESDNLTKGLKILPLKYTQHPIIAQININSIKNNFELLVPQIASNIDEINEFH